MKPSPSVTTAVAISFFSVVVITILSPTSGGWNKQIGDSIIHRKSSSWLVKTRKHRVPLIMMGQPRQWWQYGKKGFTNKDTEPRQWWHLFPSKSSKLISLAVRTSVVSCIKWRLSWNCFFDFFKMRKSEHSPRYVSFLSWRKIKKQSYLVRYFMLDPTLYSNRDDTVIHTVSFLRICIPLPHTEHGLINIEIGIAE